MTSYNVKIAKRVHKLLKIDKKKSRISKCEK